MACSQGLTCSWLAASLLEQYCLHLLLCGEASNLSHSLPLIIPTCCMSPPGGWHISFFFYYLYICKRPKAPASSRIECPFQSNQHYYSPKCILHLRTCPLATPHAQLRIVGFVCFFLPNFTKATKKF